MGRISLLERKTCESEKSIHEAEEIARGAQLEASNWKEQFENAQGTIEELQESRNLLEQQKHGLTSELATTRLLQANLKEIKSFWSANCQNNYQRLVKKSGSLRNF